MKTYIERAAVHELVKSLPKYQMFNYDRTESLTGINPDDVDFGVDKIPTADVVEVRRGRWEKHPQSNEDDPVYTCSLCKLNVSGFEKRWIKYCPNCGALMQEEDNGEK